MLNNININNFFPVNLNGVSFEPIGESSNQTAYICKNSNITFVNGKEYITLNTANQWLDPTKVTGSTPQDLEYKILKKYFDGISYKTGGNQPNASAPKSVIIMKLVTGGVVGSIVSNVVVDNFITTITGWTDKATLNLTFSFNQTPVSLTLNCSTITTGGTLATVIQTALRAYGQNYNSAICSYDTTSKKFTIKPHGDTVGKITIGYCTSTGTDSLASILKLDLISTPTIVNGVNLLTFGENMQRLINFGVMNFSQFQTMYWQDDITLISIKNDIKSTIEWTASQKLHFCYLLTVKLSKLQATLDWLVSENLFVEITDEGGTVIEYAPVDGCVQLSYLIDGTDANGIVRTQSDDYSNSIIGASVIGASGNRYADTNAYCRNPFGVEYDTVPVDAITEQELELTSKSGAIGYCTLSGNAINYQQTVSSGRNTKNLVWFDLWQNSLFAGFRIQLKMVELERKGILSRSTAYQTMTQSVQELNKAGLVLPPAKPFNYQNNKIDNEYMDYVATREFGIANNTTKTQVQNAINSQAMSFNIIPYEDAVNQGFGFKDFIIFINPMGYKTNSKEFIKLKNSFEKQGKLIVMLKSLPKDIEQQLISVSNKLNSNKQHKPVVIKFEQSSYKNEILDDVIISYTPSTIREKGLINIVDYTPEQWFNGVATFMNQLNIG